MMQDVRNALRRDGSLRVVVVQDVAKEMWTLVIAALEAEPSVSDGEELVDHYHAMGHLWAAASIQADGDIEPAFTTETTEGWGRFIFRKLTPTAHLYPGPTATASSPAMCTVVSESMSGVTMAIIASVVDTATVQVTLSIASRSMPSTHHRPLATGAERLNTAAPPRLASGRPRSGACRPWSSPGCDAGRSAA